MENTIEYWKNNAKEDFMTTPISVLRYITELENLISELAPRNEIKNLSKYVKSRLKGSIVEHLDVYSDGRVIVNAEDGNKKEFHVDLLDMLEHSADYILCHIQDDEDINVSKY